MLPTNSLFVQLAIVLGLSTLIGFFIRYFKLPLVLAYLSVGILLSLFQLIDVGHSQALTFLPDIGIAFVLFFVGMELDIGEIRSLGAPILVAGLTQIIF